MIVKIQRALMPPDGPWLVYNEDRSYYATMPQKLIPAALHEAMDDDLKGYFDIDLLSEGRFQLNARVEDQDW